MAHINISIRYSLLNVFTVDTIVHIMGSLWFVVSIPNGIHPVPLSIIFICFIPYRKSITTVTGWHGQWMDKSTWNTDIIILDKTTIIIIIIDDVCMQTCSRYIGYIHRHFGCIHHIITNRNEIGCCSHRRHHWNCGWHWCFWIWYLNSFWGSKCHNFHVKISLSLSLWNQCESFCIHKIFNIQWAIQHVQHTLFFSVRSAHVWVAFLHHYYFIIHCTLYSVHWIHSISNIHTPYEQESFALCMDFFFFIFIFRFNLFRSNVRV